MPFDEAKIGITDLGLLRGYGLFDFFRTYNGVAFQWDWYWERFSGSAEKLGITPPIEKDQAKKIVDQLISLSPETNCALRFVLTGGISFDGLSAAQATFFILSEKISDPSLETYQKGIKVETREYLRDMPEIKSTDYKLLLKIRPELLANQAVDVLFVKDGLVSELSRSNLFIVQNNRLITPEKNILKGITRRTVMELAKGEFELIERDLTLNEVLSADEVFTTSSTKKVLAISQINGQSLGKGKVGPVTHFLNEKFNALTKDWKA